MNFQIPSHTYLFPAAVLCLAAFALRAAPEPAGGARYLEELEPLVITATREPEPLKETPASISLLQPEAIRLAAPNHPQQILGQVPGVAISVTNGEGHQTGIRQPISTNPLYLFLEDGIGVRPTGFFNHNALYELNIPMAGGIEVTRGPGSSLYGSDAIGGVINVLSRPVGDRPEASLSTEAGSFGWLRELASFSTGQTRFGGVRADFNLTHTDGWRAQTGYDRQSGNFRWDWRPDADTKLKTIIGYTRIDQETGANSPLPWDLYQNAPKTNLFAPAYRKVQALRISSEYERRVGEGLFLSLTPYFRHNAMDLNGSYNFNSGDARIEKTQSQSYGLLSKWRQDFPEFKRARLILGLDLESSPGTRREDALNLTSTGNGAYTRYTGFTVGSRIYDYDVTFRSLSPYVHTELSPLEKLRMSAGARFDVLGYDFQNRLGGGAATVNGLRFYGQSESVSRFFSRLSPKLGLTYQVTETTTVYGSYNRGFRVPSEAQLFRPGLGANTVLAQDRAALALALKPIKADQFELGTRGKLLGNYYTLAGYRLVKRDDIVSMRNTASNLSYSENAGRTQSRGIELSLGRALPGRLQLETALTYAKHEYTQWRSTSDFSGREMPAAPRFLGNTRLTWKPIESLSAQLEWIRMGSYFLQDSNAGTTSGADPRRGVAKYDGHQLLNFRASYDVCRNASLFARVLNLTDRRYADSASVASSTAVYSPGLPRTFYAGLELRW